MSIIENNSTTKFLYLFLGIFLFSGFCYMCVEQTREYNERCQTKLLESYSQDSSISKEELQKLAREQSKKTFNFSFLAAIGLGRLTSC